jgi:exopolyphosphatase/guanosine-5'-triphosphate,3'-diphosphate pyrophosphatase
VNQQRLELRFPAGWLDEHPLTRADLEAEARYLKKAGFRLEVVCFR